jgi:hypothetical protein
LLGMTQKGSAIRKTRMNLKAIDARNSAKGSESIGDASRPSKLLWRRRRGGGAISPLALAAAAGVVVSPAAEAGGGMATLCEAEASAGAADGKARRSTVDSSIDMMCSHAPMRLPARLFERPRSPMSQGERRRIPAVIGNRDAAATIRRLRGILDFDWPAPAQALMMTGPRHLRVR